MRYSVERRQRAGTKTETSPEIDPVLTRGRRTRAVGRKSLSTIRVGAKEVRLSQDKLDDADIDQGICVTSSDFTAEALQFGNQ
jgi:hypothetical protein